MRRLFLLVIALASFCPIHAQTSAHAPQPGQYFSFPEGSRSDDYVPGRVVFKVLPQYRGLCDASSVQHPRMQAALQVLQASRLQRAFPHVKAPAEARNKYGERFVDLTLTYQLDFPVQTSVEYAVNLLLETGIFDYVEPAYIYQSLYNPNDPSVSSQYYLPLLQAFDAWDISKGDTNVVIGIVDTGTDFTHPDLSTKHYYNYADTIDGLDNDNDGYVDNFRGWDMAGNDWYSLGDNDPTFCCNLAATDHGVIVAGPAVAASDNNNQIASIGFNCRELAVKVAIDESPSIYNGYQGVVYAADHGAHIMNLSWGGTTRSRFGEDAINYALINKGVMVVAAAGNTPADLDFFPASFHGVISRGGTQQNDLFWNSSPSFGSTFHYLVDVCAPSRDILTTSSSTTIGAFTGTSLGSPMVCAVGGLVKSHYPSYTMAQVAQRVRVSSDEAVYSLNPASYTDKMGRGRINAYRALTDTSPSIRAVEVFYDDGEDGLIQVGDTVAVRVRFMNYLDPVSNLSITMTTPDWGQFELIHDNVYVGDLGTLDTASTWLAPFKLVIRTGTSAGFEGHLKFSYSGTNYTDWEYYPLRVEPNYVNADINRIETSLTGTGRWGYLSFPSLSAGKGLILDGVGGMMKDAGFMIGKDASHVSNNFENQSGGADNHFTNIAPIVRVEPGLHGDLEAHTVYSDAGAGANAIGVTVDQRTYQWDLNPHDNYIIQEYRITNTTGATQNDLFAGLYMNLDMYWRTNNVSKYDTLSRCIYTFREEWVTLWEYGITLLTPDSLHGYAALEDSFPYTIAEKFNALTSPPQGAFLSNKKLVQFASAGPFDIAPGDTHIVAFALVLSDSIPHMRSTVALANERYWCLVRGGMTQRPDLGADILDCEGNPAPVLDAGAGYSSYLWSTGATTQTITPAANGEYWVRVSDVNGCVDEDRIQVTLNPGLVGGFTSNPTQVFVGDTVFFTDTTANAMEWGWDFGDGSMLCPITPNVYHVFTQAGTYQVTMYVGNGVCIDTVIHTIVVDTLVGISASDLSDAGLQVWPNPASGSLRFQFQSAGLGSAELRMLDGLGRAVLARRLEIDDAQVEGELNLENLSSGFYFLEIRAGSVRQVAKVMVE